MSNLRHLSKPEHYITTGLYNISLVVKNFYTSEELKELFIDEKELEEGGLIEKLINKAKFIDYEGYSDPEDIWFFVEGLGVISKITDKPLYSDEYINCIGISVIGKDKETGKNISFLIHNNPASMNITNDNSNIFLQNFIFNLEMMKYRCEEGTIDAVLLGGNNNEHYEEFATIVRLYRKEFKRQLGIDLDIASGPTRNEEKELSKSKTVIVIPENRHIHLFKRYSRPWENRDFPASELDENITKLKIDSEIGYIIKELMWKIKRINDNFNPEMVESAIGRKLEDILINKKTEEKIIIENPDDTKHKLTITFKVIGIAKLDITISDPQANLKQYLSSFNGFGL